MEDEEKKFCKRATSKVTETQGEGESAGDFSGQDCPMTSATQTDGDGD